MKPFAKVPKEIKTLPIYKDATAMRIYFHLELSNYGSSSDEGQTKYNQLIISQCKIADDLNLTRNVVRYNMKKLESAGVITTENVYNALKVTLLLHEPPIKELKEKQLWKPKKSKRKLNEQKKKIEIKESSSSKEENVELNIREDSNWVCPKELEQYLWENQNKDSN